MAQDPDAFIREVDEELRQDRATALWQRYGTYIIAAAVALVVGTAGWVGWHNLEERRQASDALAFDAALTEAGGDAATAATALDEVAADAHGGYDAVARLTAAQLHEAAGSPDAAVASLQALAGDGSAPDLYRELAQLLDILARMDTEAPDTLIAELRPLGAVGPWRFTARELLAGALLRAGDRDEALEMLRDLETDPEAPQPLRIRARELVAALDGDG
ncbi:MAG: tetratricopeptide repeat protein [Pseudomonadota bacterium]